MAAVRSQAEGDGLVTWADLGPLKLRAIDRDGRRYPCGCHRGPAAWMISARAPNGVGVAYVTVTIKHRDSFPFAQAFENALNSLTDSLEHYR